MNGDPMITFGLFTILAILALIFGAGAMITRFYRKVDQGYALIINKLKTIEVAFTGAFVLPVIHRAEIMDISVKTIEIDRRGHEGLICKDNIRADIKVTFFVRVNQTTEDVLRVAQSVGCNRASDQRYLEELFGAKFSEALKTVGKKLDFEDLYNERDDFRDQIIELIGTHLNGYHLEDAAIDYLEQTPITSLDQMNILDAQGIRKITELTAVQRVHTNELANRAKRDIGRDDLETTMTLLEQEKQEKDATARQRREIDSVQARETATAEEIQSQERARSELARIEADQQIAIRAINKQREEEVAGKNKERVLAVETENVEKERSLQIIAREREVDLQRIFKDKELEVERKNIAEVIRERVAVQKGVAKEEEGIKDLREIAAADRAKKTAIIAAEATAEQGLVASIKAAEANEEVAKYGARERVVTADAEYDAADRVAKAKIRMAEGIQAEIAAEGLATVRVKEADALANEKQGMVEAKVLREKMEAEAAGLEEQGMVEIRLTQARADAIEREGTAQALVIREKMQAEATGKEANARALEHEGLAEAKVHREKAEAKAVGVEKNELALAVGIREKLLAEAEGLAKKAEAMKALDEVSRDHEEFRLALEQEKVLAVERFRTNIDIARAQAEVMGEAFKSANIKIVGGDEAFFNRFTNAVSLGQSLDGFLSTSKVAQRALEKFTGEAYVDEERRVAKADAEVGEGAGGEDSPNTMRKALRRALERNEDGGAEGGAEVVDEV